MSLATPYACTCPQMHSGPTLRAKGSPPPHGLLVGKPFPLAAHTRPAALTPGPPAFDLLSIQPCFCNLFKEKSLCLFTGEKAPSGGQNNPGLPTRRHLRSPFSQVDSYRKNGSGAGRNRPHGTQPAADQILGPSGQHRRSPDPANLTEHSVAFPSPGPSQPRIRRLGQGQCRGPGERTQGRVWPGW